MQDIASLVGEYTGQGQATGRKVVFTENSQASSVLHLVHSVGVLVQIGGKNDSLLHLSP